MKIKVISATRQEVVEAGKVISGRYRIYRRRNESPDKSREISLAKIGVENADCTSSESETDSFKNTNIENVFEVVEGDLWMKIQLLSISRRLREKIEDNPAAGSI